MDKKIIPMLYDIKKYLNTKNLDYFEIRFEKHKNRIIDVENTSTKELIEKETEGIGIRIIIDKKVGFLALNEFSNYKEKIDKVIENTKKINKKTEFKNYSTNKGKDILKYKDFESISNSQKIKEINEINKEILKTSNRDIKILNSEIIYKETEIEKYFLTNHAEIHQKRPYTVFYSKITGKKNYQIETNVDRLGSIGGLELFNKEEKIKMVLENRKTLQELLESKPCPAITTDIILSPDVGELLAHEAIGHACEGDFLIDKTTVLKKGLKVSKNPEVNIIDNPEKKDFGYFKYDDEGIKAKKVDLIKNGVVNDFMTDITTATKLNEISNGSARSENYNFLPIVRMSNTYFKEGTTKEKDMLSDYTGFLLKGFSGGEVDTNIGTFMFGIRQAYEYKHGEIINKYKQASISGDILKYLNKITEISNKIGNFEFGYCGKNGQTAFVSGSSPLIKIEDVIVGGTKHE